MSKANPSAPGYDCKIKNSGTITKAIKKIKGTIAATDIIILYGI
ncbi:hypothetical protein MGWOODY_XGa2108 [hydrothermal vent metagenome]|uniref:Uncharacterized protein n=1 Tax=hydrothermal vent metagenome TaxID=652676 RepID=A0A160TUI9_9ZZZZ